jgi:serine/threonine protein kinase
MDVLGAGTFGQVVKCKNMKTQEMVAVKVVKNKLAYFKQSMMEVTILEMVTIKRKKNQCGERITDSGIFYLIDY